MTRRRHRKKSALNPNRLELKQLVLWNIRGNLSVAIFDRLRVFKRLRLRREWEEMEQKKDRECIIVAGGPSFTDELAVALIDARDRFDVMGVNHYCMSKYSRHLIPDSIVLSDPHTLSWEGDSLKQYLADHRIRVFAPYGSEWAESLDKRTLFNDSENIYSDNIDPRYPRGYTSNTSFKALAIALKLGYRRIYILGLDHDYPRRLSVDKDGRVMLLDKHHYPTPGGEGMVASHFECVAHALHCYALNFWHLDKLASAKVINVTDTSLVDSFRRQDIKDFIQDLSG